MNTEQTIVIINDTVIRVGDNVKVNNEDGKQVDSVIRKINISNHAIGLWFSKNNFNAESCNDDDYDVIVHFIWLDDMDNCINKINLQIIKGEK